MTNSDIETVVAATMEYVRSISTSTLPFSNSVIVEEVKKSLSSRINVTQTMKATRNKSSLHKHTNYNR